MTVKCSECSYADSCFPILRAAIYLGYVCKQGRRVNKKGEKPMSVNNQEVQP